MLGNGALLLIDVQRGFHDPSWGQRNNLDAEKNINALLDIFRKRKMSVIHVQHISKDPSSPLRPDQPGVEFMEGIEPQRGEKVFKKDVNSAFIGTDLEEELKKDGLTNLFFIGFTSDHCVSTSARMAADLGSFEIC
jgi:nicotinamidase-related amidase